MAQVTCPACGHRVTYLEDLLADALSCPGCGEKLTTPAKPGTPPAASHPETATESPAGTALTRGWVWWFSFVAVNLIVGIPFLLLRAWPITTKYAVVAICSVVATVVASQIQRLANRKSPAFQWVLVAEAWVLSVVLWSVLFSGISATLDVRRVAAEMEQIIEKDKARPPGTAPDKDVSDAQKFLVRVNEEKRSLLLSRLWFMGGFAVLDTSIMLLVALPGRRWRLAPAYLAVLCFGLILSETQQWVLYGLNVSGASDGFAMAAVFLCPLLGAYWLSVLRGLIRPSEVS